MIATHKFFAMEIQAHAAVDTKNVFPMNLALI